MERKSLVTQVFGNTKDLPLQMTQKERKVEIENSATLSVVIHQA